MDQNEEIATEARAVVKTITVLVRSIIRKSLDHEDSTDESDTEGRTEESDRVPDRNSMRQIQDEITSVNTLNPLKMTGIFRCDNEAMYVRKEPIIPTTMIPQLGFSARLIIGSTDFFIHNEGCLLITDDNLVAYVKKLEQPELLDETQNFQLAAHALLGQIRIDQVLLDDVTAARDKHRASYLAQLGHLIKRLALDDGQAGMRIKLLQFYERIRQDGRLSYVQLCDISGEFQCEDLQKLADELRNLEQRASIREQFFGILGYHPEDRSPNIFVLVIELVKDVVERHSNTLFTMASILFEPLRSLSQKHLMLIGNSDVKQFTDMRSILRADIFEKPLQDLTDRWIARVKLIKVDCLNKPLQLTNGIFFFLCKSLEDVIVDIVKHTDHPAKDLLTSTGKGWQPIKKLVWKSENAITKCLQREYYFLFRLLQHFKLDGSFNRQPFQYEMHLFSNDQSKFQAVTNRIGRMFTKSKRNPLDVSDEFYVWYCLLDDVLFHVLPKGLKHSMFDKVLDGYVQMIRDAKTGEMETLRVVTRNLASFIAQFYSDGEMTQLSTLDEEILQKQLNVFSNKPTGGSLNHFRDHVNVFCSFWKTNRDIIDQLRTKIDLPGMKLLQVRLKNIMSTVLDKDGEVDSSVGLCRTYNDFVLELNAVSLDWYIRDIPEFDMQSVMNLVELIDNKWKDTPNRIYRVVDPAKFAALCKGHVPKHYVLEVLDTLLDHVMFMLQRTSWTARLTLSHTDTLLSTNELILAIRGSLLYLKEQVDYVDYDNFYEERVKPFDSVVKTTTSRQDFSSRVNLLKESFWYIRKQNEVSIDVVLSLYGEANFSQDLGLLRKLHAKYAKHFEDFMQLAVNEGHSERVSLIVQKVKAGLTGNVYFKTWNDRFKQDQVPQILAGLGAVWSILVSKDVAQTGNYFKPHCNQILCVLRLLSADHAEPGIDKHLAQVLTGQGKSLVLGLLAALLALTGHRVRVACYSDYLAKRDEQDFLTFYEMFAVAKDVTYGTFNDLANEIIAPTVGGQKITLRNLVTDLLFKAKAKLTHPFVAADSSNHILLMDEVDVFFSKEFYGNSYIPCCDPVIPGMDRIQEQIWKYVVAGWTDVEDRIDQFIQSDEFGQRIELRKFLGRPNSYDLLDDFQKLKTHTNKTFFDEHVGLLVQDAHVVNNKSDWDKFRLNSAGVITYNNKGIYNPHAYLGYQNVFNYFRLKKDDFVAVVNGVRNYGYLVVNCGSVSYAMLPMNYPLIVGVSGTLTSLNQYEKKTIEKWYNIQQTSVMPTFFGCSNLQFDKVANFHHHSAKPSWRSNIFSQANRTIAANRAVIIFFETDHELNAFKAEYAAQLDRLNVLTENTEDKEKFITEAGVARTITLATRGMGRGVDYKSSVIVEKNGGVHIIQTFFSEDVKEEIQIKGRTARKDNKGSYELIVCNENSQSEYVSYDDLDAERSKKSLEENAELSRQIDDSMGTHYTTMNYMKSFFQG